jgi:hypothetical protein
MVDVEARNAVIAMVMHLMSAFKMPARPRPPQVPANRAQYLSPAVLHMAGALKGSMRVKHTV